MNGPGTLSFSGRGWLSFGPSGAPPTPTPPVTNLAGWWKSDGAGNTEAAGISTLIVDESGNGNDATVFGGFIGPRVDAAAVNGLPGFNCFYALTTQMGGLGQPLADGSAFYMATIARMSPVVAGNSPGGFTTGGGLADIGFGAGTLQAVAGLFGPDFYLTPSITGAGVAVVNDGTYFVELGCDTATTTAAINGTDLVLSSAAPIAPAGAGWCLFNDPIGGNGPLWAWWAETLLYSAVPGPADLADLRIYLHSRAGV